MPYLNIDDGLYEHLAIEGLPDAAFRALIGELCLWSRTGETPPSSLARELIAEKLVRRAPRWWLPAAIRPPLRYRARIPKLVRALVYARDGWKCLHCGRRADLTLDHIVPWSAGGTDDPSNLQTLCRSCNSRKGARV